MNYLWHGLMRMDGWTDAGWHGESNGVELYIGLGIVNEPPGNFGLLNAVSVPQTLSMRHGESLSLAIRAVQKRSYTVHACKILFNATLNTNVQETRIQETRLPKTIDPILV